MFRVIAPLLGRGQRRLLWTILVEGPFAHQLPFVEARHELVDNRLERGVRSAREENDERIRNCES